MNRYHIVVSNYRKLDCFVDNFHRIDKFDPKLDRIYVFDCSPAPEWRRQLAIADTLTDRGLVWGDNLHFIHRRNWGVNHGAQLDYFRSLQEGKISPPEYTAFVQDHYFDLEHFVKEDSIPEDAIYDLDEMEARFRSDPAVGCAFFARYGIRVCTSNPVSDRKREFFGDSTELLPRAKRRCFCIDGGNFIVRPQLYVDWFKLNPGALWQGDGSYGFSHVWEVRLGQILYAQGIKWADMYRNITYSTIEELDAVEDSHGEKFSKLWYDNRVWFFFYGRDLQPYPPTPLISVLRYLRKYFRYFVSHSRDKRLEFLQPQTVGVEQVGSDKEKA